MPEGLAKPIRIGLPKGRMQEGVWKLLADAGYAPRASSREYRPTLAVPGWDAKLQKPQNIIEMLDAGSRDAGFAGQDWVGELQASVVEVLDLELDKVRLVAAAPEALAPGGKLPGRPLVVASEYERLARAWIDARGFGDRFVRSYGATESFPPEDADVVVDIAATGATLHANGLVVVDELGQSSTRLYASRSAWEDPGLRARLEGFALVLRAVIEARKRVMVECNVGQGEMESLVATLPCMREPTVSTLHGGKGYAVKVVVPRSELASLVPQIKAKGGTDVVVTEVVQVVP